MEVKNKKKSQEANVNFKLGQVIKSGKYSIGKFKLILIQTGYKNVLRAMRNGQAKMIMIASNAPAIRKTELEYYAALCKADLRNYDGNNLELGTACGKLFAVSTMCILDQGDSDILDS